MYNALGAEKIHEYVLITNAPVLINKGACHEDIKYN